MLARAVVAAGLLSLVSACRGEPPPPPPPPSEPVASAAPSASAAIETPEDAGPINLVREEREVVIAGVKERWRLVWRSAPVYDCFSPSCPCEDVTYGEAAPLDLVRSREGAEDEKLDLGDRSLQRWPLFEADHERMHGAVDSDLPLVKDRPVVTIMHFADYDHDGRAAEFVLDRGDSPCSMHSAIVIGAVGAGGRLAILSLAGHPGVPIDLNGRSQWERVRKASNQELAAGIELVQFGCGNHGSGEEVTYVVRRVVGGLDVTVRAYDCDEHFKRLPGFKTRPYQPEGGR